MSDSHLDRASEFLSDETADQPPRPEIDALGERIIETLHTVYDPEIPVDIFELGMM